MKSGKVRTSIDAANCIRLPIRQVVKRPRTDGCGWLGMLVRPGTASDPRALTPISRVVSVDPRRQATFQFQETRPLHGGRGVLPLACA